MEPQQTNENEELIIKDTAVVTEEKVTLTHTESPAPKKTFLTLPAAVLTGFALIALAIVLVAPGMKKAAGTADTAQQQPEMPTSVPKEVATLRSSDYVRGDANAADILVIEYSDSDCPFCVKFHPTLEQVVKDYKGKVAWVYRYFPLDMHPNAYTEALALECSAKLGGNSGFWKYLDSIINVTLTPDPKSNEALVSFATSQGINGDAFKACFADPKTATKVDADSKEAESIGARGTPFSIAVNKKTGKQVIIPGAYPVEQVKEMIDSIR